MYLWNGKLLAEDTDGGLIESRLTMGDDGAYSLVPIGDKHSKRPLGAIVVTVDEVISKYQLDSGSSFPALVAPSGATNREMSPAERVMHQQTHM